MTYGVWKGRKPKITSWLSLESLDDVINPITGERLGDQDDAMVAVDIERRANDITQTDETIQRSAIATDIGDQLVEVAEDDNGEMSTREVALVQAGAAATLAATGADEDIIEETVAAAAVESQGRYTVSTEDLREKLNIVKEKIIELYKKLVAMVKGLLGRLYDGYGMVASKLKALLSKSEKADTAEVKPVAYVMNFKASDVYCVDDYHKPEFNFPSFSAAYGTHKNVARLANNARTATEDLYRIVESAMKNILSGGENTDIQDIADKAFVRMKSRHADCYIGNTDIYMKDEVLTVEEKDADIVKGLVGQEFKVDFTRRQYEDAIKDLISISKEQAEVINTEFKKWMADAESAQSTIEGLIKQAEEKHPNSGAVSFFKKMYQTDSKLISTLTHVLRLDMTALNAQANFLARIASRITD